MLQLCLDDNKVHKMLLGTDGVPHRSILGPVKYWRLAFCNRVSLQEIEKSMFLELEPY